MSWPHVEQLLRFTFAGDRDARSPGGDRTLGLEFAVSPMPAALGHRLRELSDMALGAASAPSADAPRTRLQNSSADMTPTVFVAKLLTKLVRVRDRLLSAVRRRQFAACGTRAMIRSPRIIIGGQYVSIGNDFDCFPGLRLEMYDRHLSKRFAPALVIGNRVSINYDCHIGCVNRIEIGDGVLIASRVYIADHIHGTLDHSDLGTPPSQRLVHSKGPVVIEADVWIGEGVCVLPNVRIGRGAIIGANSVVTRDIPPYTIAAGAPCRVVRTLTPP